MILSIMHHTWRFFIHNASVCLQYNDIRKVKSNLIVMGKTSVENDKEDFDNEVDDDDADNAEESDGDEFEQETG